MISERGLRSALPKDFGVYDTHGQRLLFRAGIQGVYISAWALRSLGMFAIFECVSAIDYHLIVQVFVEGMCATVRCK